MYSQREFVASRSTETFHTPPSTHETALPDRRVDQSDRASPASTLGREHAVGVLTQRTARPTEDPSHEATRATAGLEPGTCGLRVGDRRCGWVRPRPASSGLGRSGNVDFSRSFDSGESRWSRIGRDQGEPYGTIHRSSRIRGERGADDQLLGVATMVGRLPRTDKAGLLGSPQDGDRRVTTPLTGSQDGSAATRRPQRRKPALLVQRRRDRSRCRRGQPSPQQRRLPIRLPCTRSI
jgi:hypothetical protein